MSTPLPFRHRNQLEKFLRAGRGVISAVRGPARTLDSSWWVHLPITVLVLAAAAWFQVATWEWCALLLAIALVVLAEMLNSAVEEMARAITAEYNRHLEVGLNIAAGAVLVSSLLAIVVGLIIFIPHLLRSIRL